MTRARALVPNPTPAQRIRRQDWVVKLTLAGYMASQIATALSISTDIVTADRNARRYELVGVRRKRGRPGRNALPDPEPIDWWSEPEPSPVPPSYRVTGPDSRIRGLHEFLKETNARNRFAYNVAEAEQAGDEEYLVGAQLTLADTIAYLQDLLKIAQDKKAQAAARTTQARDDLRAPGPLSHVTDPAVRKSLAQARPLPPKGAGIIPGRMYAYLWSHYWAGHDIASDEVIAKVASREGNPNRERIRAAAAEMKAALGLD